MVSMISGLWGTKLKHPFAHLQIVTNKIVGSSLSKVGNCEHVPEDATLIDYRLIIRSIEPAEFDRNEPSVIVMDYSCGLLVDDKLARV